MLNGDLKSRLSLWENLASNRRYRRFVETEDILTVKRRVDNEGLSFLTIALPSLGKALDTFHSTNEWVSPESFKTDEDGIPIFLGKAIRLAIDGNSVAVDCIRQLTYVFYKLEVKYDEERISEFLDQFVRTDRDLADTDFDSVVPLTSPAFAELSGKSGWSITTGAIVSEMRGLISKILRNKDPMEIRPCHGSGATACHTPNHDKWHKLRYYAKLDAVFDYSTYFYFSPTHLADDLEVLENSELRQPEARVCLVPKDSRGPRVISCEPAELMYIQQGLMRSLYEIIENHPLTRGRVNFSDQGINRELAFIASKTGRQATLDLKDASDRVSRELVKRVFPEDWFTCLDACRSENTILPDDRVVELNKFAPMGSSCCFPVEALVFWACAVATLRIVRRIKYLKQLEDGEGFITLTPGALRRLNRNESMEGKYLPNVYVYGDDIICNTGHAALVIEGLEAVGLIVNRSKSYVAGPFRESCGGDYHNGCDVTPVRVRDLPSSFSSDLNASADLINEFIDKFGYEDSHPIIRLIEDLVGYSFPRTELDIPMSIRVSPSASNDVMFKRRWSEKFQRFEHRVLVLRYNVLRKREPNWFELLRKELSREKAEAKHLYENKLAIVNARLDAGCYAVDHSAHAKWSWVWLG
jgi:hypothetical protein